jgi:N-acetylmuramoyl-L-alanine amidase
MQAAESPIPSLPRSPVRTAGAKKPLAIREGCAEFRPDFLMKKFGFLLLVLLLLLGAVATPAVARPTIVIDAGHGGHDRGGVPGQKYSEKIYALDVARRVQARLKSAGYRTVMTRSGDYFVGLRERCAVANRLGNAVFLSVHFNSAKREGANGIETYYYSSKSLSLARAVHTRVVRAAGTENRGVRQRGFFVIRRTSKPAVLAELGFLTNGKEGSRIANSSDYRQRLADALAEAVIAVY